MIWNTHRLEAAPFQVRQPIPLDVGSGSVPPESAHSFAKQESGNSPYISRVHHPSFSLGHPALDACPLIWSFNLFNLLYHLWNWSHCLASLPTRAQILIYGWHNDKILIIQEHQFPSNFSKLLFLFLWLALIGSHSFWSSADWFCLCYIPGWASPSAGREK